MKTREQKRVEAIHRLESGVVRDQDLHYRDKLARPETLAEAIQRRMTEAARLRTEFGHGERS